MSKTDIKKGDEVVVISGADNRLAALLAGRTGGAILDPVAHPRRRRRVLLSRRAGRPRGRCSTVDALAASDAVTLHPGPEVGDVTRAAQPRYMEQHVLHHRMCRDRGHHLQALIRPQPELDKLAIDVAEVRGHQQASAIGVDREAGKIERISGVDLRDQGGNGLGCHGGLRASSSAAFDLRKGARVPPGDDGLAAARGAHRAQTRPG